MSVRVRSAGFAAGVCAWVAATTALAATAQDQQFALAAEGAVKLVVRGQGWLHVGQPELVAAGLAPTVDPAALQLFADGVEQAIAVTGNGDATFAANEAIEFYGTGRDTLWSDARTYWLIAGAAGARVPVQSPATGGVAPSSFVQSARLVEHKTYLASVLNGDETNIFGAALSSTPTMETITVQHLDVSAAGATVLRVRLQGVTATAHAVDVMLNGQDLGTCTLGPQAEATFSFGAPNAVEGDNQITLTAQGASDYTALESLELDYGHTFAADGDALLFTAPAATRLFITGFSTPDVRVVDVTDATHPVELVATVTTAGTASVDTPASTGPRTLYAFTGAKVGAPASVAADAPSSWSTSHDGELVVLSHASFMSALAPLVARRRQDGWSTQLVDLQDVYDEFGGGDKTVFAIRDFLQWATAHWRVPPRFVLLVGDATFDPRNFLGLGDFDFAPTKLIDTSTMETASDDWFVDADLDGVPEIAIGRIPVRTPDEATAVVAKTLAYAGTADLPRGGLFVTDVNDPDVDFEAASAASEVEVSALMPIDRFARSQAGATSDALLTKLNEGPFLVNYFGHGSVEVWDDLLSSTQATTLTNAQSSIYVVMNCLNGFFHDLYTTSLAEALLEAPQGGAVAVWASSTLADFTPQPAYNQEFLMRLTRTSLGEAAIGAKQSITDLEARRTWILFGDPTLFGKPLPPPDGGAGPVDGGGATMDAAAEHADATSADGGVAMDAATGVSDASPDASPETSSDALADAAKDGAARADGAATGDAGADADGGHKPPPTAAGCGCSLDAKSSGTPTGVGLLALACVAAMRGRRRRRAPRRSRWPLGLLALAVTWLAWTPGAHATTYTYRKALTIDRTRIGNVGGATTLTNYPLLINMTDAVLVNGAHVLENGVDITFTAADTTTCGGFATCTLNFEVEQYVAGTGQIIAWVQIPTLKTAANTANTVIYIQYGNATAPSAQSVNATWDTSYKGVWHLNQSPVMTQTDSTATGASATASGTTTPPTTTTGLISGGVNTSNTMGDGYFDYLSATFNYLATDSFTYSGWFKTSDTVGPILSQRDNLAGNPVIDIMVGFDGLSRNANTLMALVRDDNAGSTPAEVTTGTTVNDNAWHYFTLTRTGGTGTIQLYLDGASAGSATSAGASSTITTGASGDFQHLGKEGNWVFASYPMSSADDRYLAASFDEFRISKAVRTSDWIITDYRTQNAPASTFSASAESGTACGNGMLDSGEACDDGNLLSGDGCSTACAIESGYTCSGTPSSCFTTCGDGVTAGSESCDDGNLMNGDGCSSTCTIESGYHCATTLHPSVCSLGKFEVSKTIVINKAKVGTASAPTTLSDYPILFSVTDSSLLPHASGGRLYTTTATTAYDLQFRGEDTVTCNGASSCQLAHEIESYNSATGAMVAWVRIPTLNTQTSSTSTTIKLYLGNTAITTTTEQVNSTWNSNFTSVWHLNQSPTTTMTDSTSNGNTGTGTALTTTSSGQMGSGVTTDGSTSYMAFNSGSSLNVAANAGFTYSAWVETTATFGPIVSLRQAASGTPVMDIAVGYDGSMTSSGSLLGLVRDSGGTLGEVNGGTTISNGAFHLVTVTRSGSSLTMYLDATQFAPVTTGTNTITSDIRNMGREGYWETIAPPGAGKIHDFLAATFDEVRSSNTARSFDWVTTDYNAQSSPSTFITYTTGASGETVTDIHTDVEVISFDAADQCAGTALDWQTAYEGDTLGFNVYRELDGQRVQLNPTLIVGAGLTGGVGHAYHFVDGGALDAGRTYALEEVHFDLTDDWFGPAAPTAAPTCGGPAVSAASTSLADERMAPTPIVTTSPTAAATDQTGGCSLSAGGGQGDGLAAACLVVALAALARRRRRR